MRYRIRPGCIICGRDIIDDFCIVTDEKEPMHSCVCLDCRDNLQEKVGIANAIWLDMLMPVVDRMEKETPFVEYDIIDTAFAAAYG